MRGTYIMRRGRLVLKRRESHSASGVHVISDDLKSDLEHHGYADGRRTASKSQFRRWTKEAGLVEKGNDRERVTRPVPDARRDVAQAIHMLKNGYRLQMRGHGEEGWH